MAKVTLNQLINLTLVSLLTVGVVGTATGCNRKATNPAAPATGNPNDKEPVSELPPEPSNPGDDNNDGSTDLPQEPGDTPEPLPAPSNPVQPGQPITAKAIAKTTQYILPVGNVKGTYVNIELTWQPVNGAAEYWVFKNILPKKEEATKGSAYKIVKANGVASTIFYDGIMPPSFAGGNIWDKIKRGFQAVTIKPGVEYKYKVLAADMDGNVIGESDAAITIPLPPIAAPTNIKVSDTNTVNPLFQWEATPGTSPDGYYISVYPPIQFGKQSFTPTKTGFGLSYWSTFRIEKNKLARYGGQNDNTLSYPGTLPFDITFPLRMGNRYSVSVTAVKTDSNDMRSAKAISKSWSESKIFVVGTDNTAPAPAPSAAPAEEGKSSTGLVDKIKGIFGL